MSTVFNIPDDDVQIMPAAGSSSLYHSKSYSSESGSAAIKVERAQPPRQSHAVARSADNLSQANAPTRNRRPSPYSYDEDELPEEQAPGADATDEEKRNWKRLRNTIAARKSRTRKNERLQELENDVKRLCQEKAMWKERAHIMERLLVNHGLPSPNFLT
ncbi:hypothetical protein B0H34DRAFT_791935 [Crassisporium funariophilum]|nr:hypothetical protein B0H34DRAFT_791935 [Crassisporium funariophilum]